MEQWLKTGRYSGKTVRELPEAEPPPQSSIDPHEPKRSSKRSRVEANSSSAKKLREFSPEATEKRQRCSEDSVIEEECSEAETTSGSEEENPKTRRRLEKSRIRVNLRPVAKTRKSHSDPTVNVSHIESSSDESDHSEAEAVDDVQEKPSKKAKKSGVSTRTPAAVKTRKYHPHYI